MSPRMHQQKEIRPSPNENSQLVEVTQLAKFGRDVRDPVTPKSAEASKVPISRITPAKADNAAQRTVP